MKQARDLFLLSAIAYRHGKHEDAGRLFATAMSAPDSDEFLNLLNEEQTVTAGSLLSVSSTNHIETSLEAAASKFSAGASEEDEDEEDMDIPNPSDDPNVEDFDEDEDESEVGDEPDPDRPGHNILPSTLTSGPDSIISKPKIVVSSSLKTPIKLRTRE